MICCFAINTTPYLGPFSPRGYLGTRLIFFCTKLYFKPPNMASSNDSNLNFGAEYRKIAFDIFALVSLAELGHRQRC